MIAPRFRLSRYVFPELDNLCHLRDELVVTEGSGIQFAEGQALLGREPSFSNLSICVSP